MEGLLMLIFGSVGFFIGRATMKKNKPTPKLKKTTKKVLIGEEYIFHTPGPFNKIFTVAKILDIKDKYVEYLAIVHDGDYTTSGDVRSLDIDSFKSCYSQKI